jgi:NAD(P)-dependent dehydrogenase (short-subunit alcohol dehydrogenase family)
MPHDLFDLTGKVGLVTGANAGLGLGFARGMAKAGADVVIWGRRSKQNEEAAEDLRQYGGRVLAQSVDVSDEGQVAEGMMAAVAEMDRLDCVVANAGISSRPPSFHEMPSSEWHGLLDVSLHGAFYTFREAAKHMVARAEAGDPGGSLVGCGSGTNFIGVPRMEHYGAAKGGMLSMIRGIAVEYGRYGIRANLVAPGYFDTGLARDPEVAKVRAEEMKTRNPIPRPGVPADLEGIIVYLMSDASSYHTGDAIVIDGGKLVAW